MSKPKKKNKTKTQRQSQKETNKQTNRKHVIPHLDAEADIPVLYNTIENESINMLCTESDLLRINHSFGMELPQSVDKDAILGSVIHHRNLVCATKKKKKNKQNK